MEGADRHSREEYLFISSTTSAAVAASACSPRSNYYLVHASRPRLNQGSSLQKHMDRVRRKRLNSFTLLRSPADAICRVCVPAQTALDRERYKPAALHVPMDMRRCSKRARRLVSIRFLKTGNGTWLELLLYMIMQELWAQHGPDATYCSRLRYRNCRSRRDRGTEDFASNYTQ